MAARMPQLGTSHSECHLSASARLGRTLQRRLAAGRPTLYTPHKHVSFVMSLCRSNDVWSLSKPQVSIAPSREDRYTARLSVPTGEALGRIGKAVQFRHVPNAVRRTNGTTGIVSPQATDSGREGVPDG